MPKQQITVTEVLSWADAFHARHSRWPGRDDGVVPEADLTWPALSLALKRGYRGLPGGRTLAELLRDERGARHKRYPPRLTIKQILTWADDHHRRTEEWPGHDSGEVPGTNGETWLAIETALRIGRRGLKGGSSVARLLEARRGITNHLARSPLTPDQVLAWVDAHHERTGSWPTHASGQIVGAPGETWNAVNAALLMGHRGLSRGGSLARLMAEHRAVRHPHDIPRLSVAQVLAWADAHKRRTGEWPITESGSIADCPTETWAAVNAALENGVRGFPGDDSLAQFLARHRDKRNTADLPSLTLDQVRGWMLQHRERTGEWPKRSSGPILGATAEETWSTVSKALERGRRGLPGRMTLTRLANECQDAAAAR